MDKSRQPSGYEKFLKEIYELGNMNVQISSIWYSPLFRNLNDNHIHDFADGIVCRKSFWIMKFSHHYMAALTNSISYFLQILQLRLLIVVKYSDFQAVCHICLKTMKAKDL